MPTDVDAAPAEPKCLTKRVGSTRGSSRTENMKKLIRVGVLGCGYWGPLLIRNFRSLPDCRLKVVCDLDIARLKHACALYSDLEGVTSPERVIKGTDLEAVVIATPVKSHYALAKASLLAGKHTFIEKPMATSTAECEELIDIARAQGVDLDGRPHISLLGSRAENRRNRASRRFG